MDSRKLILAVALILTSIPAGAAHQFVVTTGYANSRTPEVGSEIDTHHPPFRSGGGFAFGLRVDVRSPRLPLEFGPSFLFWNNLTGDPDPNANASYFQIELGGRISLRTRTIPSFYAGTGVGYSIAHGEVVPKVGLPKSSYDGEFPTGSVHFGVKTKNPGGLGVVGEGSFHFGLDDASGNRSVGPANAWLVQIGVAMDVLIGQPSR